MRMDYSRVITKLTESYTRQHERYMELHVIVQKILGQIAISRGDFSGVMGLFEKKQQLLDVIEKEREAIKPDIEYWQNEKKFITASEAVTRLNTILAETESSIKSFLEAEDQLQRYLEHHLPQKGNPSTT